MDMKKQTGDHMKETVLLYGFKDQERLKKVKRALLPLGLRMRTVGPEEYFQPVGYLAGVKEVPPAENDRPGTEFDCEMMVMAGLASAQVDAVIHALYRSGVGRIDYKAVLTPVNQFWDGEKLYEEKLMAEEGLEKTDNELIHITKPIPFDVEWMLDQLEPLMDAAYKNKDYIRDLVADLVSTYQIPDKNRMVKGAQ